MYGNVTFEIVSIYGPDGTYAIVRGNPLPPNVNERVVGARIRMGYEEMIQRISGDRQTLPQREDIGVRIIGRRTIAVRARVPSGPVNVVGRELCDVVNTALSPWTHL